MSTKQYQTTNCRSALPEATCRLPQVAVLFESDKSATPAEVRAHHERQALDLAFSRVSEFMSHASADRAPLTEHEALALATHRHYKGGLYRELFDAKHSETGEMLVIYVHLYPHEPGVWARPVEMFHGTLEDHRLRFTPLRQQTTETKSC